jgi:hypothetical protein
MKKKYGLVLGFLLILGLVLWAGRRLAKAPSQHTNAADQKLSAVTSSVTKVPGVAKPSDLTSTPQADNSAVLQFYQLGVLKRNEILAEIQKRDLASIFKLWLDSGRIEHDNMKRQAVGTLLGYELQKRPIDQDFYRKLQEFTADSSNSFEERGQLVANVLRGTKTKESLDLLIQTATDSPDSGLRQAAIEAIQSVGASRGDGKDHEELSPGLERVWQETQNPQLIGAVAKATAEVGAPSGIKVLLTSAMAAGGQSDTKKQAALIALHDVRNPHAVPMLDEIITNQPPNSEAGRLVSAILAEMNNPSAAGSLINWLRNADASAAPLAFTYVVHLRSPLMLEAYEGALKSATPFRSEENRQAIREGLAKYRASYK